MDTLYPSRLMSHQSNTVGLWGLRDADERYRIILTILRHNGAVHGQTFISGRGNNNDKFLYAYSDSVVYVI